MFHRAALVVSTALTVVALLTGIGLAIRTGDSQVEADVAVSGDATQSPSDADDLRLEYIDRLQTSNAALTASYERITALLDDVDRLNSQNAELLEREAIYKQQLTEANDRLEQAGRRPVPLATTAAGDTAPQPAVEPDAAAHAPTSDTMPAASASSVSPRLVLAPDEPVSDSALPSAPPLPRPSAPVPPTATAPTPTTVVTARLSGPSVFAPAPRAPSEIVAARPPTVTPAPTATPVSAPPLSTSSPSAVAASQPQSTTRLIAAIQPTPTPQTSPIQVSAKRPQTHDGDGDADGRGGDGKDHGNDHRRQ